MKHILDLNTETIYSIYNATLCKAILFHAFNWFALSSAYPYTYHKSTAASLPAHHFMSKKYCKKKLPLVITSVTQCKM